MFQQQTTKDKSSTFFNEKFQESYHSSIGAYTEALHKHVLACAIDKLAKEKDSLNILDVCFGLAYNSGVAIEKALEVNPKIKINIVALENDIKILKEIKNLHVPETYQSINSELAKLADNFNGQQAEINTENFSVKVLIGDARESIKELNDNFFDAIFFDPFSPKVCPELWTEEFICETVDKAKSGAYISTYSSARVTKDSFTKAKCELHEGPKLNRRNGGVLALKI